jgi:hypothetical protein
MRMNVRWHENDPGHGRLMKEWVALDGEASSWVELAQEARRFVGNKE